LVAGGLPRPRSDEDMEIAIAGRHRDRRPLLIRLQIGIDVVRETVEQRNVRKRRDEAARQNDLFPADLIRERAEDEEERRRQDQRQAYQYVGRDEVELQIDQEKKQRVELPGIPDYALP